MIRFIKWLFSPTKKPIIETNNIYDKLIELEEKYQGLLSDVKRLEEENIETTNTLYEVMNCMDALDARIDILAEHYGNNKNV
jgi:hypothetical protein